MPLPPAEAELWWAPASPIRLGEPFLGRQALMRSAQLTFAFWRRVARESAIATLRWLWYQGLVVFVVSSTLVALLDRATKKGTTTKLGVAEKGTEVSVGHTALVALVVFAIFLFAALVIHALPVPPRLVEEERRRIREEGSRERTDAGVSTPPGVAVVPPPAGQTVAGTVGGVPIQLSTTPTPPPESPGGFTGTPGSSAD